MCSHCLWWRYCTRTRIVSGPVMSDSDPPPPFDDGHPDELAVHWNKNRETLIEMIVVLTVTILVFLYCLNSLRHDSAALGATLMRNMLRSEHVTRTTRAVPRHA
jgi:hypothetical protein